MNTTPGLLLLGSDLEYLIRLHGDEDAQFKDIHTQTRAYIHMYTTHTRTHNHKPSHTHTHTHIFTQIYTQIREIKGEMERKLTHIHREEERDK